ncbi:MAG: hypothetical protein PHF94_02790 [Methanothrix sp.]|nr:hypothetical protein [Methanothrix sp.]MDD4580397.1 hypothetical protein [Methanothrix sp.]
MNDEFGRMLFEEKVSYLIENLRELPDDLAEEGVEVLAKAGETEYAVVLARDKGMIDRAITVLVDAGDYLWAALIAKNAGQDDRSDKLYRDGLKYYIEMEMFGRAISAASALGMSPDVIEDLYQSGVARECRDVDLAHSREMIDCAMQSLDMSIVGREDDMSQQLTKALQDERNKMMVGNQRKA